MGRGRRFGLAALAGAAAALGHAPFGLWLVSLIGFALLILLVAGGGLRGTPPRTPEYFRTEEGQFYSNCPGRTAWFGGVGYFAVALHWIVEPFLVDIAQHGWMAPFALVFMAGGLALFWALAGWVSARCRWPAIGFAVALALAEMARGHVLTGFPWAMPAYIWADTWLLDAAATVGPYGLSLLTLLLVSGMTMFFQPGAGAARWPGLFAIAGASVVLVSAISVPLTSSGDTLGVVRLVQPNAPQDEKWDPDKAHLFVNRALDFTAAPKEAVDLIVWPESAVPYPMDQAGPVLARAAHAAEGAAVVTGINRRNEVGEWFNALVEIGGTGELIETYDKVHLVPFGEYIPLKIDLLRAMAGFTGFGFSAGEAVRLIETPLGKALPLICYEAIFPGHGAGVARPDYLLQITNDAWFGTFSGPYQHLDQARFRAVEQGVSLVRAANTGISAVIDPTGRVTHSLALGEAGWLDAPVPTPRGPTPYSRTGDKPLGVILIATLAALLVSRKRKSIAKQAASS